MSTFKAGDKIRPKPGRWYRNDWCDRRVEYISPHLAVYSHTDGSGRRAEYSTSPESLERDFEVVEPFFEPGKTYKRNGYTFECIRVDGEGVDGGSSLVAYGRVAYASPNAGDPSTYMDIRRQFNNWEEEAPTGA